MGGRLSREEHASNVFKVQNIDKNEAGILEVSDTELIFTDNASAKRWTWPLKFLRKYGCDGEMFVFEAGRKCPGGEGLYAISSKSASQIFELVAQNMNKKRDIGNSVFVRSLETDQPACNGSDPYCSAPALDYEQPIQLKNKLNHAEALQVGEDDHSKLSCAFYESDHHTSARKERQGSQVEDGYGDLKCFERDHLAQREQKQSESSQEYTPGYTDLQNFGQDHRTPVQQDIKSSLRQNSYASLASFEQDHCTKVLQREINSSPEQNSYNSLASFERDHRASVEDNKDYMYSRFDWLKGSSIRLQADLQ